MTTPITESVILAAIAAITLMVLGCGWLVYLARGGKPFAIELRGLGIEVNINRKEATPRTRRKESGIEQT